MGRVLVLSDHDLGAWRSNHQQGETPSELPYGVDHLEGYGHVITSPSVSGNRVVSRARKAVEGRYRGSIELPLRSIPSAINADVVIALLETHSALPSLFKRRHIPPFAHKPLAALICWLSQDAIDAKDPARREHLRRVASGLDLLIYFSSNQTSILESLGVQSDRLLSTPYGIDSSFYSPGSGEKDIDILAVGHDRGRDYKTLFDAVARTELSLDLICRPSNIRELKTPPNVRVHRPVSHVVYRKMLRQAKVVVVPTHELAYPTGQSVALEASSCECCVIASRTPALSEYFDDGTNALLSPVSDSHYLRYLIREALSDQKLRLSLGQNARDNVLEKYTTQHMWDHVLSELDRKGYLRT